MTLSATERLDELFADDLNELAKEVVPIDELEFELFEVPLDRFSQPKRQQKVTRPKSRKAERSHIRSTVLTLSYPSPRRIYL